MNLHRGTGEMARLISHDPAKSIVVEIDEHGRA
jgi:hypothetical protein